MPGHFEQLDVPGRRPDADVRVRIVYREWWRRILVLSGTIDATVTYNGMGNGETVFLAFPV